MHSRTHTRKKKKKAGGWIARGDRGVSEVKREPAVANSGCVLLELTEGRVCV